jgi:hypothetical protein
MPKRWFVRTAMAILLLICGFVKPADLGTRLLAGLMITWGLVEIVRAEFVENKPTAEEDQE